MFIDDSQLTIAQRKQLVLMRAELLRRNLTLQMMPWRGYMDLMEGGVRLARSLSFLLTPRTGRTD